MHGGWSGSVPAAAMVAPSLPARASQEGGEEVGSTWAGLPPVRSRAPSTWALLLEVECGRQWIRGGDFSLRAPPSSPAAVFPSSQTRLRPFHTQKKSPQDRLPALHFLAATTLSPPGGTGRAVDRLPPVLLSLLCPSVLLLRCPSGAALRRITQGPRDTQGPPSDCTLRPAAGCHDSLCPIFSPFPGPPLLGPPLSMLLPASSWALLPRLHTAA